MTLPTLDLVYDLAQRFIKPDTRRRLQRSPMLRPEFCWDDPWFGFITDSPVGITWVRIDIGRADVTRLLALGLVLVTREDLEHIHTEVHGP